MNIVATKQQTDTNIEEQKVISMEVLEIIRKNAHCFDKKKSIKGIRVFVLNEYNCVLTYSMNIENKNLGCGCVSFYFYFFITSQW